MVGLVPERLAILRALLVQRQKKFIDVCHHSKRRKPARPTNAFLVNCQEGESSSAVYFVY